MANFRTVRGTKASALDSHELLYIHCVSKERFELVPYGFECVKIECCELHISFLDSLDVRRIALCPSIVNGLKIEEAFAGCDSPTLIQMHSSCDFRVRRFYSVILNSSVIKDLGLRTSQTSVMIIPINISVYKEQNKGKFIQKLPLGN